MNSRLHPLIEYILYAKSKPSLDCIKSSCVLDENGEIDVEWYNSLNDEQRIRMDIAAFIQDLINKRMLTYNSPDQPRQVINYTRKR